LFQNSHTGINNKSYHRGDSWYFVNNIAAMSLAKLDYNKYKDQIEKIKNASVNEMLYSGFLGQCAELSSAEKQDSSGCLAQAWSASTLSELLFVLSQVAKK
jgi:glycogen debranching enzyme